VDSVQGCDLAPFFGDLSQSKKRFEINRNMAKILKPLRKTLGNKNINEINSTNNNKFFSDSLDCFVVKKISE
jgi:hypothetical protein